MRYIVRRCAVFFEAQSEIRALRDEIVLANPGLVQRTFAIERHFESILADALASARLEGEASTGTLLDAALCMVVVRLALIAWRYEGEASLLTLTDDTSSRHSRPACPSPLPVTRCSGERYSL